MSADQQSKDGQPNGFTSLKAGSTDSRATEAYYDDWAATYDVTLSDWHYQAPVEAAQALLPHLFDGARVLDVGCGTGLFARALDDAMQPGTAYGIDGVDISQASLDIAKEGGLYDRLIRHDLQQTPLPVETDAYDACACIGVLTYIEDAQALLADMCRAVRREGYIAFTQRDDRWADLDFETQVRDLESRGLWSVISISHPRPYLPGNDEFGEDIRVIHVHAQVL